MLPQNRSSAFLGSKWTLFKKESEWQEVKVLTFQIHLTKKDFHALLDLTFGGSDTP